MKTLHWSFLTFVFASVLPLVLGACQTLEQGRDDVRLVRAWALTESLDRPESVIYDPARGVLYVSSIGGDASAKDGNGYLSKVSADGAVIERAWVSGLDAPKGLALVGDRLYAADIDELVEVDAGTGRVVNRYPAAGAEFLNDVTADARGNVYVSDSRTGTLYRLSGGQLRAWLQDERIQAPNGLYAGDRHLIVAAGDPEAENPGSARYLQTVDYDTKAIAPLRDRVPLGSIDAVEPDGRGGYFLSDWGAGKVLYFTPRAGAVELLELSRGTADLDYAPERRMVYLPVMMSDQLVAFRVE